MNHLLNLLAPNRTKIAVQSVHTAENIIEIQAGSLSGPASKDSLDAGADSSSGRAEPGQDGDNNKNNNNNPNPNPDNINITDDPTTDFSNPPILKESSALNTVSKAFKAFIGMETKAPVFIAKIDLEKEDEREKGYSETGSESVGNSKRNRDTMTKEDLDRYKLLEVTSTKPNGESVVRHTYESETNVYVPGESILKSGSSYRQSKGISGGVDTTGGTPPRGGGDEGNGQTENIIGWRSRRRMSLQDVMNPDVEDIIDLNSNRSEEDKKNMGGDLLYEMRKAFMDGDTAEEQEKNIQDAVASAAGMKAKFLGAQTEGESAHVDIDGCSFRSLQLTSSTDNADQDFNKMPDERKTRLRIHPSLIVTVVENWLNEDKEDGTPVVEGDIWWNKEEITTFREAAEKHTFDSDLKDAQENLIAMGKRRKTNDIDKQIMEIMEKKGLGNSLDSRKLARAGEEKMVRKPSKAAGVWEEKTGGSEGISKVFFMGEDGVANFEREEDAAEDRTWERKSRRSRYEQRSRGRELRQKQTALVTQRQYDRRDREESAGSAGSSRNDSGDFDLLNIANSVKAEAVAACLSADL